MKRTLCANRFRNPPLLTTMKLSLAGNSSKYSLLFQSACTMRNRYGGMDGYTYSFNGRSYRDVDSLWTERIEDLTQDVSIGVDKFGEKVLRIHYSIPTFDSGDREWDSMYRLYLMFDGKDVHLVTMNGGYRIAKLTFYEKLLTADARMKPIFERLGWPTGCIEWI